MKPGLSLRMSQHLALTPQLQQSIRLLQLSTLELSQEVDQMLDENPFLERSEDEAPMEAFGLEQSDTYVSLGDRVSESASTSSSSDDSANEVRDEAVTDVAESWDGDGSVDMRPDDSEWGGDAGPRQNTAKKLPTPSTWPAAAAHSPTSCTAKPCRCACRTLTAQRCVF